MGNGYLTESEVQFIKNKDASASKFKEVFDMYHEVVPREGAVAQEPPLTQEKEAPGDQTVDSSSNTEQQQE